MSPKELAYVEDALGHTSFMKTRCSSAVQSLNDEDLKQFVQSMMTKHSQMFNQFYNLV